MKSASGWKSGYAVHANSKNPYPLQLLFTSYGKVKFYLT